MGYNAYRAKSVNGARIKLNATLIGALPGRVHGATHIYMDTDLKSGTTYFYLLETVKKFGPPSLTGPKSVKVLAGIQIDMRRPVGRVLGWLAAQRSLSRFARGRMFRLPRQLLVFLTKFGL